jgi:hypothetical protein
METRRIPDRKPKKTGRVFTRPARKHNQGRDYAALRVARLVSQSASSSEPPISCPLMNT